MPATRASGRGSGTPRNTIATLEARVSVQPNGCWRWTGTITTNGYGQVGWRGRRRQVHCLLYELLVGPIPQGLTLDHTCRNRSCVNPEHLEPVTNHENILRGEVPSANRSICKSGRHLITRAEDIYVDSDGCERCRECRLESKRRHRARRLAAA